MISHRNKDTYLLEKPNTALRAVQPALSLHVKRHRKDQAPVFVFLWRDGKYMIVLELSHAKKLLEDRDVFYLKVFRYSWGWCYHFHSRTSGIIMCDWYLDAWNKSFPSSRWSVGKNAVW